MMKQRPSSLFTTILWFATAALALATDNTPPLIPHDGGEPVERTTEGDRKGVNPRILTSPSLKS